MLLKYGAVGILLVAGLTILDPARASWLYIAACAMFEMWLARRIRAAGRTAVPPSEPPYRFTGDEARLVGRYRFYFTYPAIAKDSGSVLAALGLSALLLAPWLTYKQMLVQAVIVGINLFAVARFTKVVAPLNALRAAGARGDRDALTLLEAHDGAWAKIRTANAANAAGA